MVFTPQIKKCHVEKMYILAKDMNIDRKFLSMPKKIQPEKDIFFGAS